MKTKNLKQTVNFPCAPSIAYQLLMDGKKHSEFTGGKATISKKINGKFSVYGGYIHGYNIELVKGRKIVQAWHFAEEGWPDEHFSLCTFDFAKTAKGTRLTFTQKGIPSHKYKELKAGWRNYYWLPMIEMLKGK
ncbi:MAG: SRPBCC domain-containing protein [Bacteroidetes bacterium]|nr:SRPBCC domain-containing protein [Bacteroidota bacterium]